MIEPEQLAKLSPPAWLAVMQASWLSMTDIDLLTAIGDEVDRRHQLHSKMSSGEHLIDVWRQLNLFVRRPKQVVCRKCGEPNQVK